MKEWFKEAFSALDMTEEARGYLLGRGATEESYTELGEGIWRRSPSPCPDSDFRKRYGLYGEDLEGMLVCPARTPRGDYIGFEARSPSKDITRFMHMPRAKWVPVWIAHRDAPQKLWDGGEAWIVEGRFDLYPMEWVVPEQDVVMASFRGEMSWNQVHFLRRMGTSVHLAYDRDDAGRTGTEKALKRLRWAGVEVEDVYYSGGKDPGEIWDNYGVEGLRRAFHL